MVKGKRKKSAWPLGQTGGLSWSTYWRFKSYCAATMALAKARARLSCQGASGSFRYV